MTDTVSPSAPGFRPVPVAWWVRLLIGAVLVVLGVALILSPGAAAVTLAWLVGFGLILHGIEDLVLPGTPRWLGIVTGIISIGAGIVSLVWPGVTLWALAVVTGIAFLLVGITQVAVALTARHDPAWGWALASGVLSVVVGIMALAWPGATALVLALLLGIRTLIVGAVQVILALDSRRPVTI